LALSLKSVSSLGVASSTKLKCAVRGQGVRPVLAPSAMETAIDTAVAEEVVVARPLPVADVQVVDVEVF
jgi:hypothetical protein